MSRQRHQATVIPKSLVRLSVVIVWIDPESVMKVESERGTSEKVADRGESISQLVPRSALTLHPAGTGIEENHR